MFSINEKLLKSLAAQGFAMANEMKVYVEGYILACEDQHSVLEDLYQSPNRDSEYYNALEAAMSNVEIARTKARNLLFELRKA